MKKLALGLVLSLNAVAQPEPRLFQAIQSKNLAQVRSLVQSRSAMVNQADNFHGSPLNTAVRYGSIEIVNFLLAAGARVNVRESMNFTLLEAAAAADKPEAALALVKRGAPLEAVDDMGRTPLLMAVETGSVPVARILIDSGANLAAVSKAGRTPLSESIRQGRPAMVEYLLRRGAPSKVLLDGKPLSQFRHLRGPNSSEAKEIQAILKRYQVP